MRQPQGDEGFTLLELLIATILGGFLLAAVSGALAYTGRARARIDRSEAAFRDIDAAKQMISRILANAQPVLNGTAYADRTVDFDGSADEVRFIGRLPDAVADDQIVRQELFLEGSGSLKSLWLSWSLALPPAQADAVQPLYRMKIVDKVRSLHFAFFGRDQPQHRPAWRDAWTGLSTLPLLVRVEIGSGGPGKAPAAVFFVAPVVSATPGCRFNPENVACRRVQ